MQPCPRCGSTREPKAQLIMEDTGDGTVEYTVFVCPDCGAKED